MLFKGLCFCKRYAKGSGVRNGAKLSGWMVDSQEFRKIDWVTFSERIVAQSCNFILVFGVFVRMFVVGMMNLVFVSGMMHLVFGWMSVVFVAGMISLIFVVGMMNFSVFWRNDESLVLTNLVVVGGMTSLFLLWG